MPGACCGCRRPDAPGCAFGESDDAMAERFEPKAWHQERSYIHLDGPLHSNEHARIEALVTSADRVASHAFWPLIRFVRRTRQVRSGRSGFRWKSRPICYASHTDAAIFAYYAAMLSVRYEARLQQLGLESAVLAYRSIPSTTLPGRGQSCYDMAVSAFAEILDRGDCDVVALDIREFFDSIAHRPIKLAWESLLEVDELPLDHFKVFRAATRYACVSSTALRKCQGLSVRMLRRQRRLGLSCDDFDRLVRKGGLLIINKAQRGIPQGLPISGLLANISLLAFDEAIANAARNAGASYRRYSDDILIIAPRGLAAAIEDLVRQRLMDLGLELHDEKADRVQFVRTTDGTVRVNSDIPLPQGGRPKPLRYLGLEFDGERVRLRPQTLTRFDKRMGRAVERAFRAAKKGVRAGESPVLRRRDIYARFSHLRPHPETPVEDRPRGSLPRHALAADRSINSLAATIPMRSDIRRQLKRRLKQLQKLIGEAEARLRQYQSWWLRQTSR